MKLTQSEKKEFNQERMCEICENSIIGGCSLSSTFQCEGSFCDEAEEIYIEEIIEGREERRIDKIDELLNK